MHMARELLYSFFSAQATHHSNSVTAEDCVGIHYDVVSYVGQDVDHCDNGHGDSDGQGQVPTKENDNVCLFNKNSRRYLKYLQKIY